jgi:diaminohydroxyphosphoribosylaminopyrimidine deaminase/5-amino-6-(5-phosphoribosylamino)uracil reductase
MPYWSDEDISYMKEAFRIARQGWGIVSPNPLVGAVLVRNGKVVGQGWHLGPGQPHAEIAALSIAGKKAKGSVLYVTLEPCNHYGKTPPCTEAIIKSGIKKVFYSIPDPNPKAKGGAEVLERNGIATNVGLLSEEALELNQFFIKWQLTKKPFVILKTASSLDGKIATQSGDSRWISSKVARNFGHYLRAGVDAIMIGRTTAFNDDPLLSARPFGRRKINKEPKRVVLDPTLKLPLTLKLFDKQTGGDTIIVCAPDAPKENVEAHKKMGTTVIEVPRTTEGLLSLSDTLNALGELDVQSVLIEPGGRLASSALIFEKNLVDLIHIFIAPKFIGGTESPSMLGGKGISTLSEAPEVEILKVGRKGPDVHLTIRPKGAFQAALFSDGTLNLVNNEEKTPKPKNTEDNDD